MTTCAFIPARATSRRFPGKNLADFRGRPLVAWAADRAREGQTIGLFDQVVLSTDDAIIHSACRMPTDWRPESVCGADVPVIDVLREWLGRQEQKPDAVCVLWPTSPLRTMRHLVESFRLLRSGVDVVLSVVQRQLGMILDIDATDHIVCRRQFGATYQHDGTALWTRSEFVMGAPSGAGFYSSQFIRVYHVGREDSADIDTPFDLAYAEWLYERRRQSESS